MNPRDIDCNAWQELMARLSEIAQSSLEPFAQATITNGQDFIAACRSWCPAPESIGKGYWSTFCISWAATQIEVFEDRFELYVFGEGKTAITYYDSAPGAPVPETLLEELKLILSPSDQAPD